MLKKVHKYVTNQKFSKIIDGIFTTKLMFGMKVWGGLWDIPGTLDKHHQKRHETLASSTE